MKVPLNSDIRSTLANRLSKLTTGEEATKDVTHMGKHTWKLQAAP